MDLHRPHRVVARRHQNAAAVQLAAIEVGPSGSSDVAFSPDGKLLYASGVDGIVRVYLRHVDDLIALARTRVTRGLTEEECKV